MRFYTVHARPARPAEDPDFVLVRESFSWSACLFAPLWAVLNRQWQFLLAYVAVAAVMGWLDAYLDERLTLLASLLLAVVCGLVAHDVRRWSLTRSGYRLLGVVTGRDEAEAERRALDGGLLSSSPAGSRPVFGLPA